MKRTREQITGEIAALTAELALVQPNSLTFSPGWGGGAFVFHAEVKAIEFTPLHDGGRLYKYIGERDFESLRDWLNYHFPKGTGA